MEKEKIYSTVLIVLIFVSLCFCTFSITKQKTSINELNDKVETLQLDLSNSLINVETMKLKSYKNNIALADLWFMPVNYEHRRTIQHWEQENVDFMRCQKELKYINIVRNYYDNNEKPDFGKYLVLEYNKGDLVYSKLGTIECYKTPIMELNPEPINCINLCEESVYESRVNETTGEGYDVLIYSPEEEDGE